MTEAQQKEQFSIAYVRAVAAVAGVNIYRQELDDESVDIGFSARVVEGLAQRPRLEAQLKCTQNLTQIGDNWRFPLSIGNYNDLRADGIVPMILVVLRVPSISGDWLEQSPESLILRHAAFWVSLAGEPETSNTDNVTVSIPIANVFSVRALRQLLGIESNP